MDKQNNNHRAYIQNWIRKEALKEIQKRMNQGQSLQQILSDTLEMQEGEHYAQRN